MKRVATNIIMGIEIKDLGEGNSPLGHGSLHSQSIKVYVVVHVTFNFMGTS